jgi:Protein of unknown function (DUF2844)
MSNKNSMTKFIGNLCCILVLGFPILAQAELGGNLASITQEQKTFGSTLTTSPQSNYTIYIQNISPDLVIKEYVSNSGNIFGVAWKGSTLPNFQIILGNYYSNYLSAQQQNPRSVFVRDDNLVLESGGMMGGYIGRAYLPKQLPEGMTPTAIQ